MDLKPKSSLSLTDKDIETLKKVEKFHLDYADFIKRGSPDLISKELSDYHLKLAEGIAELLEKTLERNLEKTTKIDRSGMISPGFV